MKSSLVFATFVIVCAAVDPALAQTTPCTKTQQASPATATSTKIITGSPNSQIYLCGYVLTAGAAQTAQFEYGTGTTCSTGTVVITPALNFGASTTSVVDHPPYYSGLPSALPGNDVCVVTTTTGQAGIIVYYAQY